MINYIELQDDLKNLSDDQVKNVAVNPANPMYGTLAVAELDRRNRMRMDQQARMASPMTTIADQLILGVPNTPPAQPQAAGPAMPPGQAQPTMMPQQVGPVGPGMAGGGSVDNLRGLQALMRTPELESIEGAMARAQGLSGEDPAAGLRALIERYREGAPDRRRMDVTQLLARIGSGLMNSRRPDYLGALGEGAAGGVEGLEDLVARRNTEAREEIGDEGVLARMASDRQGRELDVGMRLFGAGREGLEQAADIESGILNSQTQRDVANIYASRAAGGTGGSSLVTLRALVTRASVEYNTAFSAHQRALQNAMGDQQDPTVIAARQAMEVARARRDEAERRLNEALISGSVGGLDALPTDPAAGAAPNTNNPNVRQGGTFYDGVNRTVMGARVAAQVAEMARRNGWDAQRAAYALQQALAALEQQGGGTTPNPGSYEEYANGRRELYNQDLGGYAVRTE